MSPVVQAHELTYQIRGDRTVLVLDLMWQQDCVMELESETGIESESDLEFETEWEIGMESEIGT
jgi:hypothetical protein